MSLDQAAMFLAGSIIMMLGLISVVVGVVIVNRIIHRFWKPVKIFWLQSVHEAQGEIVSLRAEMQDQSVTPKTKK